MLASFLIRRRREKLFALTKHPQMRQFLSAELPAKNTMSHEVEYLAVDLEMSGLDANKDQILSIGLVPIIDRQVVISQASHHVIKADQVDLSETAPIHQLRDIDLVEGQSLETGMSSLLSALQGRILVLHHAPLDSAFLDAACQKLYGVPLLSPTIDTLLIERNRNQRHPSKSDLSVRLGESRRRYNLPDYTGHNAIIDAIATAELWLAQLSHITADEPTPLSYFVKSI